MPFLNAAIKCYLTVRSNLMPNLEAHHKYARPIFIYVRRMRFFFFQFFKSVLQTENFTRSNSLNVPTLHTKTFL